MDSAVRDGVLNATDDTSLLYNATLKLASRVLDLSSRVLARIRSLDDVFNDNPVAQSQAYASTNAEAARRQTALTDSESAGYGATLPGPWGFVTSGYFLGLLLMAFLLNRIHNIVVPRRNPSAFRPYAARHYHRNQWTIRRLLWHSLFPVDLSSTTCRCIFRLPSIYLLAKSLVLWSVLLLQASGLFPSRQWHWLQTLGAWASQKPFEDISWFTFTSACTALSVAALTNGLDGVNLNNNAPFNLFSFAFQLYIYASQTQTNPAKDAPARPDKHIMITIMIPILQLAMTHCLEVKQKWARLRLVPTTLCACLSLIHFHSVAWTAPASYPLTNFVPAVVESLLLFAVLFAIALNALTQILAEGALTRPLFGHAATLLPKWDEDFSVVLFRLGTASLEATSVAGLGNEVGSVAAANAVGLAHRTAPDAGEVEMDRSGVVALSRARARRGLANEIGRVRAHAKHADFWLDAVADVGWPRALGRLARSLWRAGGGVARLLWAVVRGRARLRGPALDDGAAEDEAGPVELDEAEADVYGRFLRGEAVSDDEDEFEPARDGVPARDAPSSDTDDEYADAESEAVQLYADLSQEPSAAASAPLFVAHMTSPSALTRRRYKRLVSGPPPDDDEDADDMAAFVRGRRKAKGARRAAPSPSPDQSRWTCVICTTEPREVICWPCRCLALCDDCRGNLASRSSASKHTCPCCRRSVEGYSKIYIP